MIIFRIMFEIYDGYMWSAPAYVTISIEPVNDNAPEISLVPTSQPFTEGTAGVQLLDDLILTDRDHAEIFNLTGAYVSY